MTIADHRKHHTSLLCCLTLLACGLLTGCSSSKKEKNIVAAPALPEEEILTNAVATYDSQLYQVSLRNWTDLRDGYPTSYSSTLAELKIADSQFYAGDFPAALVSYEEFSKLHPGHEAMPYVRYQIGNAHLAQYKDIKHDQGPLQSAIKAFQLLIEQSPKSEYVVLARRRLQKARELQAEYERYVAGFYEKRGLENAAQARLQNLAVNFPDTQAVAVAAGKMPTKVETPAGGKSPARPRVLGEEAPLNYASLLGDVRSRSGASVKESEITPAVVKPEPKAEQAPVVSEFECEENETGAVFIVHTSIPVRREEARDEEGISFSLQTAENTSERATCSAGGVTLEATTSEGRLHVGVPEEKLSDAQVLLLNRPDRVVIQLQ